MVIMTMMMMITMVIMMMMTLKVEVNGSGEHPIFKHLKTALPLPQVQKCDDYDDDDYDDNDDSDGCKDIYQDEPEALMSDPRLVLWSPLRSETFLLYHVRQINLSRE